MEEKVFGIDEIESQNTAIDDIDSENVTLMVLNIDKSGSMFVHVSDMITSLKEFKDAIGNTKEAEANEILVARADFGYDITVGGYKPIGDFDTSFSANGMTALYDVIVESAEKLVASDPTKGKGYMEHLLENGMRTKAVFAVFSDGADTCSKHTATEARAAIERLNNLEIVTAFIGFGSGAAGIADSLGFKNKLDIASTASDLRKAFNCLSKSVVEASKSVTSTSDDTFFVG